jgi:ATP-binding cassette subfamily F protein uup
VSAAAPAAASRPAPLAAASPAAPARTKLSYKEQRELDALPARIDALEVEHKALVERLSSGELYTKERQRVPELQARLQAVEVELHQALERWEVLASR